MHIDIEVVRDILRNWDIDGEKAITQIYKSAWDIDKKYILKTGTNIAELEKNIQITQLLRNMDIPAAEYILTKDGRFFVITEGDYFCLMKKVCGIHIDLYSGDYRSMAYKIGKILGRLHLAFKKLEGDIECHDNDFSSEIEGWIAYEIRNKCVDLKPGIMSECLKLKGLYYNLPRQIIHRDVHLGNMLFQDGELSGFIDFDLSQKNVRLLDVCYLTLSILVGNQSDEEKSKQWYEIYRNIFNGYDEICHLTIEEKQAVVYMFLSIELLFTAYFLKIGQEEFAKASQDMLEWLYENRESLRYK